MLNNPTTNQERGKSQLYDVNNLYIITTYRKVRADFETTRYITEYFIGDCCLEVVPFFTHINI